MDSKGNQLVKKRLHKFWVVLGLYGLPTGSATDASGLTSHGEPSECHRVQNTGCVDHNHIQLPAFKHLISY